MPYSWWYFVWVFGYEDAELLLRKYVLCLGIFIYMRMQRSSWSFGYKDSELLLFFLYGKAEFILSKLELCLVILDMRMQS